MTVSAAEDAATAAEPIRAILEELVRERQGLGSSRADAQFLEANRRSIAYWQAKLDAALAAERDR